MSSIRCWQAWVIDHRSSIIDPADYPWSSYHWNALGQSNDLVVPHPEYLRLGESNEARQAAYSELFNHQLSIQSNRIILIDGDYSVPPL